MDKETQPYWTDGIYKIGTLSNRIFKVTGKNVEMQKITDGGNGSVQSVIWKHGSFGECHPDVAKITGQKTNNIQVLMWGGKWRSEGVISDDGKTITIWSSMSNQLDVFEWISEEEYTEIRNSGDPYNAPTSHYKVRPDNVGKLLWITGRPGTGKSTIAQHISKTLGYVYYEGDAFFGLVNPYIPPNKNELISAVGQQTRLKGIPQERLNVLAKYSAAFKSMRYGQDFDMSSLEAGYDEMCKDIIRERARIGGDWVIAHSAKTKSLRDYIRKKLGPDLIFVALDMNKELQMRRLEHRHGNRDEIKYPDWVYNLFEPAQPHETQMIEIVMDSEMSRDDAIQEIFKKIAKY